MVTFTLACGSLSLLRHLPHIVIKGVLKTKTCKTPNRMTELYWLGLAKWVNQFHLGHYTGFPNPNLKADTHKGFCSRSMLQDYFACVSTHEGALFAPGACSQVFKRLNIVEHFAGWKFCSQGWSIPMKSLVHTEELCSWSMLREQNPSCVAAFRVSDGSWGSAENYNIVYCKIA